MRSKGQPVTSPRRRQSLAFFGLGQISRSILWCATDMLIGYHLVDRLGFSGGVAGAIMFVTFALSALPDIFVANWLARQAEPIRVALRLQFVFGSLAAVTGLLLFGPAPSDSYEKIGFVCAVSIAFRLTYAIYDVSQNALISLLPRSQVEVRRYVTSKTVASSAGRLLASFLVFWALSSTADPMADFKVLALVVLPVIVTGIGLVRTKVSPPVEERRQEEFSWGLLPFGQLALPVMAITFQVAFLGLICRLLPLFGSGRQGFADSSSLVLSMVCGTVIGPTVTYVAELLGSRRLSLSAALSFGAALTGIQLLVPHGVAVSLVLAFLYGAALSGITNIIWERVAFIATDFASITGIRIDAPAFALLTTAIKLAIAICNVILGVVLDRFRAGDSTSVTVIIAVVLTGGLGTALFLAIEDPKVKSARSQRGAGWSRSLRLSSWVGARR